MIPLSRHIEAWPKEWKEKFRSEIQAEMKKGADQKTAEEIAEANIRKEHFLEELKNAKERIVENTEKRKSKYRRTRPMTRADATEKD
jgi:hypothetical protein